MNEFSITYYEHYRNKDALSVIESYCEACEGLCNRPPEGQRPDIFQLKETIISRTYKNIRPISELTEIIEPIGPTYPTEEFLVCLREDSEFWKSENIDDFIDVLRLVWWYSERNLTYDPIERTLSLITSGWSGNEAIIDALQHTPFWIYKEYSNYKVDYTFKFPVKEG